eukprot:TRINITY_DN1965_c0_g1_i1.p1 TRINITY_DN1965_c0_g1~~TRINITY_DN1965_c0_g1_i1.p1  ORF type:complete len:344 (+),score=67.47 TRINITY_DN1965_c0_g1_i1:75-1106(+)
MPDYAYVVETEPGLEIQFCSVLGLPIEKGHRVRTLPGFHLLSLSAGREALARGSYQAFGQKFPCHDLEYLHPEDRAFICAEDNKMFLNQMSMQYHRYINHELGERKEERKRLRERAAERHARSVAHAAAQQKQQQQQEREQKRARRQQAAATADGSGGGVGGAAVNASVGADPYLPADTSATTLATEDPYGAAAEDPYLADVPGTAAVAAPPGAPATDPVAAGVGARAVTGSETAGAAVSTEARPAVTTSSGTASVTSGAKSLVTERRQPQLATSPAQQQGGAVSASVGRSAGTVAAAPSVAVAEEEDLYGDVVGGDATKRVKSTSTYATAIGAILGGFDDED